MKILCVNQTYAPDVAATAQFLTDLCEHLIQAGHEVSVVCAGKDYLDSAVHLPSYEVLGGVRVYRVSVPVFSKERRILRILGAMLCNVGLLWKMLMLPRHDRIVALTSPPLIAWFALGIARLKRSELVYWVMDINPEQAFRAGWLKRGSIAGRFLEYSFRQVLRGSLKIIPLDRYMSQLLREKAAAPERLVVTPLWAEVTENSTRDSAGFRRRHGLEGMFVVMYAGNHSICHPLTTVLEAALARRDDNTVRFVFIGGGARIQDVRAWKEKYSLENIIQLPYFSDEETEAVLSAADVHLIVMGEGYVGVVHPSKIYRIVALGKLFVLVGPMECAIGNLIAEKEIGLQVNHGESVRLGELLGQIKKLPPEQRTAQEENIRLVSQMFAPEKTLASLAATITGLCG